MGWALAEKWQKWMPFHIDRFRGSQEVQAMNPAGRMGYLYLLASAWQTDDCTISSDPVDLATESGLGDELWAIHGPRILRNFVRVGDRLRNLVIYEEWLEAKRVFDKRRSGAVRTNSSRSAHAVRTQSERRADTYTYTGTYTEKKQKTSRVKRESDPRHVDFKAAIMAYAVFKGVTLAWDGSEAKALALLLASAPDLDLTAFRACLNNRARSPATPHGERPRLWLPHILRYQQGPLNEFGKVGESNGFAKGKTARSIDAAAEASAIIEQQRQQALRQEAGNLAPASEAWDSQASQTGHGRLLGPG